MGQWIPDEARVPNDDVMPGVVARFQADRGSVERRHAAPLPSKRHKKLGEFLKGWRSELETLPFEEMTRGDQLDWLILKHLLKRDIARLDREMAQAIEAERLLTPARMLVLLEEDRRDHADVDAAAAAATLNEANTQIADLRKGFEEQLEDSGDAEVEPAVANRAAKLADNIREMIEQWYEFYAGYDPIFTWWCEAPHKALGTTLTEYAEFLRKKLAGAEDEATIIGDPIGRDALIAELEHELVSCTPEELIEIGQRELDWCHAEMVEAAVDMGLGDDWRAALELVKDEHCPPGGQPALVRDLAVEAIGFIKDRDLV
ncbi:MAG TPA: DUF885 family protein, partial [Armatimonadota bacterium]|nr:DUF885 family protein [Armatimonadota bacterium]